MPYKKLIADGISIDWELQKSINNTIEGEVHSIFKRACNLKTSEGEMVSIIARKNFNGPNTVLIPEGIKMNELLDSGEKVMISSDKITFKDTYINLKSCSLWKYNYRDLNLTKDELRQYIIDFINILRKEKISDLMDTYIIVKHILYKTVEENIINVLSRNLSNLLLNLKENNKDRVKEDLNRIIGLGCGLTPAGDDILVGMAGVFHRLKKISEFETKASNYLNYLILSIEPLMAKTNFISSSILGFSIEERFSQFILELLDDLFCGIKDNLFLNKLLNYGGSSGMATGLGIILGSSLFF